MRHVIYQQRSRQYPLRFHLVSLSGVRDKNSSVIMGRCPFGTCGKILKPLGAFTFFISHFSWDYLCNPSNLLF